MKNILLYIISIMALCIITVSCNEQELTPVLSPFDSVTGKQSLIVSQPSSGGNYILTETNAANIWETVVWESVNELELTSVVTYFQFTDSVGTAQEESYTMQPGFIGNSAEITEAMINEVLLFLGYYTPEALVDLQLQLIQHVGADTLAYVSSPITFSVIGFGGVDPNKAPRLWAVGEALPAAGWSWDNPVILEDTKFENIFRTPELVELSDQGGANFRFFAQTGWDGTSYNYPYFVNAGYTIDPRLIDAEDDDNNFKFIGKPGEYYLVVDHVSKTVKLEIDNIPVLYVPGDHQGWKPQNTYLLYSNLSDDIYMGYLNFTAAATGFKVNPAPNWDEAQYGTSSPAGLSGALELGGGNIQFEGSEGSYKLTADLNAMTWTLEAVEWSAVKDSWGLIGDATPGGWDNDTDMNYKQENGLLELTVDLVVGAIKFRANDTWGLNYGDGKVDDGVAPDGIAEEGADNIAITQAGNYTIVLDMRNPEQVTYSITKN